MWVKMTCRYARCLSLPHCHTFSCARCHICMSKYGRTLNTAICRQPLSYWLQMSLLCHSQQCFGVFQFDHSLSSLWEFWTPVWKQWDTVLQVITRLIQHTNLYCNYTASIFLHYGSLYMPHVLLAECKFLCSRGNLANRLPPWHDAQR